MHLDNKFKKELVERCRSGSDLEIKKIPSKKQAESSFPFG